MADDLVQPDERAAIVADLRHHWPTQIECLAAADQIEADADAIARKDAEIAELRTEVKRLNGAIDVIAESHRWVSKQRERAEARVREALSLLGEARNYLEGLDIADTIDALVLLDTEEAK